MLNKIYELLGTLFYNLFGGKMADWISDAAIIKTTGPWGKLWKLAYTVADDVFVPIGATIVCIMFFAALIEKSTMEKVTAEAILREVIKLCCGLYLVQNAMTIITGCINIGNGLATQVKGKAATIVGSSTLTGVANDFFTKMSTPAGAFDFVVKIFTGVGVLAALVMVIICILNWVIMSIIFIIMKVICITRSMEIMVKAAVSPLALCDTLSGNFLNSHAIGFLRSFFATCLQSVFLTIIASLIPAFTSGMLTVAIVDMNVGKLVLLFIELFVVYLSALVLMFKSGSLAKEIMGAR